MSASKQIHVVETNKDLNFSNGLTLVIPIGGTHCQPAGRKYSKYTSCQHVNRKFLIRSAKKYHSEREEWCVLIITPSAAHVHTVLDPISLLGVKLSPLCV